jgi:hypothetical protein
MTCTFTNFQFQNCPADLIAVTNGFFTDNQGCNTAGYYAALVAGASFYPSGAGNY